MYNPFWLPRKTYWFWPLRVVVHLFDALVPLLTFGFVLGGMSSRLSQMVLRHNLKLHKKYKAEAKEGRG